MTRPPSPRKGSRQARRKGASVTRQQKTQLHQGWQQQKGRGQAFVPTHGQKTGHRGNR